MQSESEVPQGAAGREPPEPATAEAQRAAGATVDTPVATPVPARALVTRRLFILGGFWSIIGLALVGLLGLWRRCPHLGCPVPWRADFTFLGRTGWFRCPCHGSTYTKEGGILVAGPAPRPLDLFDLEVQPDKSVVVPGGVTGAIRGGPETPSKTKSYDA